MKTNTLSLLFILLLSYFLLLPTGQAITPATPTATPTPASGCLTDGLYAYFKLDEPSGGAADATGNHNMIQSGTIYNAPGVINTARAWVGAANTFFIANTTSEFSPGSNPFSISYWFNLDNATQTGNDTGLVSKSNGGSGPYEWISWYGGGQDHKIHFGVSGNGSTLSTVANWPGSISPGAWYYVACGWDGSNVWISVNGSPRITTPFIGPIPSGATRATIGVELGSGGNLTGKIDEVGFWMGRCLTQSEVSQLY